MSASETVSRGQVEDLLFELSERLRTVQAILAAVAKRCDEPELPLESANAATKRLVHVAMDEAQRALIEMRSFEELAELATPQASR